MSTTQSSDDAELPRRGSLWTIELLRAVFTAAEEGRDGQSQILDEESLPRWFRLVCHLTRMEAL